MQLTREFSEPKRSSLSYAEAWEGEDLGIISAWERGRELRNEDLDLTQKVLQKVGAFYEGYDTYGFEHIGHSIRIFRSGLSADLFCCPSDMKEYLYSHDYDDKDFFTNKSTIDLQTKNELTLKNKDICNTQDIEIYIPL